MRAYPCSQGLSIYAEDITERKWTERALQDSEKKFRTIFDSAGDAIFIVTLDERIIEANRVASERLGCSREQLLRMTVRDIDTPEYAQLVSERLELLQRQGFVVFESAHKRVDGTAIPVDIDARIIDNEGQPAILSVVATSRGASRRRPNLAEARAEVERRAAEFESLLASIADGAALFDADGVVTRINAAASYPQHSARRAARGG